MENRIMELEHNVELLTTLLNASLELTVEVGLNAVLKKIINLMCEVAKAEAGTLWLVDYENNVILPQVAIGPFADKILNIRLKFREGVVGQVIANNASELVQDVTKDPNWAMRVDVESGFITRSLMTVPLSTPTKVIGALQLVNKQGDRLFTAEDLSLTEALAAQSALAIHNSQMYDEMQILSLSVIRSLVLALDARDTYTAGHSSRVSQYSVCIAKKLGLNKEQCQDLEFAALLHDIGKMAVPDYILGKPGKLTDEEFKIIKEHPLTAEKILSKMEPKRQGTIARLIARSHHEKYDGSGYPDGLKGDKIPLLAKIVTVADAFDAMTSNRPYRKGRTFKEALDELEICKNSHFDPKIVDAFNEEITNQDMINYCSEEKVYE